MALISRWEISNFLSSGGQNRWNPDFIGEVYDFGAMSAAVVADNGVGKTSTVEAILALLSNDNKLVKRTQAKAAPESYGFCSHIRVEFVLPETEDPRQIALPVGDRTPGEYWVFGMYLYRNERPVRYSYQGKLEDVPVHEEHLDADGEVVKAPRDDQDFTQDLPKDAGFRTVQDWITHLCPTFMSRHQLTQLVEYQKRGGGDKAASFYNVTVKSGGETFDQAFFRQIVAPELLTGIMEADTADGTSEPAPIETGIVQQTNAVISAKLATERKHKRVEDLANTLQHLDGLKNQAEVYLTKRAEYDDAHRESQRQLALLHALVNVWHLPGVPLAADHEVRGLSQQALGDLRAIAYLPDDGMAVSYRWIRQVAPAAYKRLSRSGQAENPLPFAIEKPGTREGTTARISGYYRFDAVRETIAEAEANADQLTQRLDAERHHAAENAHATRRALELARENVRRMERQITEKGEERERLQNEENQLLHAIRNLKVGEQAFARLKNSGHFSEADLSDPAALKARLQGEEEDARAELNDHQIKHSTFQERAKTLQRVQEAFGERDPGAIHGELQKAVSDATQASSEAERARREQAEALKELRRQQSERQTRRTAAIKERDQLASDGQSLERLEERFGANVDPATLEEQIREEGRNARKAHNDATAELEKLRHSRADTAYKRERAADDHGSTVDARDELADLETSATTFAERFPERAAATFEADLRHERTRLADRLKNLRTQAQELEGLTAKLADFRGQRRADEPDDPDNWIEAANATRADLQSRQETLVKQIADIDADLTTLKTDQVAPTRLDRQAREALGETFGAAPHLHEVIDAAEPDETRRSDLLTHFAAVLFAPVYEDEADAREAARILGDQRLPVPVFVAADVQAWARGEQLALERRSGLVRGVFAGAPTRPVEVLLDPKLIERERENLRHERDQLKRELDNEIDPELARLAPEGELLTLARAASRAVQQDAETLLAGVRSAIEQATRQDADLAALQDDAQAHELARRAARFQQKGGRDELARLRTRVYELTAEIERLDAALSDLDTRIAKAETALQEATKRRDKALQAETLLEDCTRAKAFVNAGGREKLTGLRRELKDIETRLGELASEIQQAEDELARREKTAQTKAGEKAEAEKRQAKWQQDLDGAADFIADGGPAFLAESAATEEALKTRIRAAKDKLTFNFDDAAQFVQAGGKQGLSEQADKIEGLKKRSQTLHEEIEGLKQRKPEAESTASRLAKVCREVELAVVTILATYDKAVTILSGTSLEDLDISGLEDSQEARLVTKARAAITHGQMTQNDLATPYMGLRNSIEKFEIANIQEKLRSKKDARDREQRFLNTTFDHLLGPAVTLPSGLSERLREAKHRPEQVADIHARITQSHARETQLLEESRAREEESREQLSGLLVHLASHAGFNLQTMKRVLSESDGATFELEASAADQEEIGQIMENVISLVETRRKRHDAEHGFSESGQEDNDFQKRLEGSVRDLINARMFPGARVKVKHPTIRNGHPFYFDSNSISGGQATALMLMWTIKLAAFSVARDARSLSGAARKKMRRMSHSIIIVDGLFSDLSEPNLIRESMNAMKSVHGHFQLIGLIHSPHYRNDWELFPTCIEARKMVAVSETGEQDHVVAVRATTQDDAGRVTIANHRARSTLRAAE